MFYKRYKAKYTKGREKDIICGRGSVHIILKKKKQPAPQLLGPNSLLDFDRPESTQHKGSCVVVPASYSLNQEVLEHVFFSFGIGEQGG